MNHDSNSSPTDHIDDLKYVYRRNQSQVYWLMLAAVSISILAYLLMINGRSEMIFLWALAVMIVLRAVWVLSDTGIKFGFNSKGLFGNGHWIEVQDIKSFQIIERKEGVRLQYFVELTLPGDRVERIEFSGLDKPAAEILKDLAGLFESQSRPAPELN